MAKLCQNYTNQKTGKTYPGCGQPLKWVDEQPLTKVGEWPGGRPKYAGHYEHYDGSPSRHDDSNPPNQKAYQQTYAPQIEQSDKDQARLQTTGYADAKSSSLFEQFTNTKLEPFMKILEQKLDKLIDNGETKAASNNVGIVSLSRDLDNLATLMENRLDELGQKFDAVLKTTSFQGAAELYKKESGNILPEGEENGNNGGDEVSLEI